MELALNQSLLAGNTSIKDLFFNEKLFQVNEAILEKFVNSLDETIATKETYLKGARKFIKWATDNGIEEVTYEDILSYKTYLRNNYTASTISMYVTSLKRFYKYLETKGIKNLASDLKGAKQSRNFKKDTLSIDQVKDILNNIDRTNLEGLRDYALVKLLLTTGLRTIEIERANIEDIRSVGTQNVLYIQGKGRQDKDDFVVLPYNTLKAIQDYLKARNVKDSKKPLFASLSDRTNGQALKTRSIRDIVKKTFKRVGIVSDKITTHSLRHTAITFSLLGGASLQEAQNMARHSNINTTLIYAHNIDRMANNGESKVEKLLKDNGI